MAQTGFQRISDEKVSSNSKWKSGRAVFRFGRWNPCKTRDSKFKMHEFGGNFVAKVYSKQDFLFSAKKLSDHWTKTNIRSAKIGRRLTWDFSDMSLTDSWEFCRSQVERVQQASGHGLTWGLTDRSKIGFRVICWQSSKSEITRTQSHVRPDRWKLNSLSGGMLTMQQDRRIPGHSLTWGLTDRSKVGFQVICWKCSKSRIPGHSLTWDLTDGS